MPEQRETYHVTMQMRLDGTGAPADVVEGVKALLAEYATARDSYMELIARYWLEYDGLAALLKQAPTPEEFVTWMRERATSSKTVQNRGLEVQREHPALDARPDVRRIRNAQATQGPVR